MLRYSTEPIHNMVARQSIYPSTPLRCVMQELALERRARELKETQEREERARQRKAARDSQPSTTDTTTPGDNSKDGQLGNFFSLSL